MRNHFNFWKYNFTSKSGTFCTILLLTISIIFIGCKEEHLTIDQDNKAISTRGGGEGEGLSTAELIALLGTSCIPDSVIEDCDSVLVTDTIVIQLPDYPGCSFTIAYDYYACRSGTNVVYFLADFRILSHNCPAFTTAINNAYAAGESALNEFIGNFDYDVATQFQLYILNSQHPDTYDCEEGHLIIYQYTRAGCFKNCIINYPNGSSSQEKLVCGSDCCTQRIKACRDENGTWIIQTFNYSSSDCEDPPMYEDNSLPIRCTTETECTLICPAEH